VNQKALIMLEVIAKMTQKAIAEAIQEDKK
jgi:hypothetical protein